MEEIFKDGETSGCVLGSIQMCGSTNESFQGEKDEKKQPNWPINYKLAVFMNCVVELLAAMPHFSQEFTLRCKFAFSLHAIKCLLCCTDHMFILKPAISRANLSQS